MRHQEFEPPEELRDSIRCFWHNTRDLGGEESQFEVLPDGYAEIIFLLGSPCSVVSAGVLRPLPSPFLMGLLNQPVVFSAKHRLEILGVRCFPWAVLDLLGLPSGGSGVRTFEHPIAALQPGLRQHVLAGRVDEALFLMKQYFLTLRSNIAMDTLLFRAGAAMRQAHGALPVSRVAAAAHATVRTLERKFKQSSGHTVKDVAGVMRFEQVRNRLWLQPDSDLAVLALEWGYTDQSHLSREFKRYSGTTPAVFARSARQEKLTVDGDFVAFVQA